MDFLFIEYISMNIKDISMNIYYSGDTVENLLNVFRLRFVPTVKKVQIKCAISIVNFQPPLADGLREFTAQESSLIMFIHFSLTNCHFFATLMLKLTIICLKVEVLICMKTIWKLIILMIFLKIIKSFKTNFRC